MMINWMVNTQHAKLDGLPKLMVNSDIYLPLSLSGEVRFISKEACLEIFPS